MILQVKYEGPAEDFAWIVPLPGRPRMKAVEPDKSPFGEISIFTQRRQRYQIEGSRGLAPRPVKVLERKVVGVYDITVLAAGDPKALATSARIGPNNTIKVVPAIPAIKEPIAAIASAAPARPLSAI